jgi:DNA-binding CsgD family transcriptional regulator
MARATERPHTTAALVGRRLDLAEIDRFLTSVEDGAAGVLVLSGPAGIGKTTLWQAGIEAARERGFAVVSARPTEVETGLAFAALGDLVGPLLELPLPPLPEPQREALDAALLRTTADAPPHPLGVSLATLHVLRTAADEAPVLVAIDDAPWLDDASARAIEFAMRRLADDRVGFLVGRRTAAPADPLPSWLSTAPPDRFRRLDLEPMTVDETGALLRERLGLTLRRPVLVRLHAITGGTPFYAIELGRDLQLRDETETAAALEAPRTLDRLVGARISSLGPEAAEVALLAAALSSPTTAVLEAAAGPSTADAGLADAEAAGLLERSGQAVRFTHPLLAAATYARARPDRVRAVHQRLAAIVTDPEERARHLARTATGPDAVVAESLESAAAAARRRGSPEVAAELAEDAARLTPPGQADQGGRRLLLAADHLLASGDLGRADAMLDALAEVAPAGPVRAGALVRRARIALYLMDSATAERLLLESMPQTAGDPTLHVEVHALLASIGHLTWRHWRPARLHMWEALRLARELGDTTLLFQVLGHAATWRHGLGRPWRDLMAEADALEVPEDAVPALEHPDLQFARLLAREGDATEARRRVGRLVDTARDAGDWTSLPRLLVSAATVEVEAGDLDRAESLAAEARTGLLQTGEGAFLFDTAVVELTLAVLRGRVDEARDLAATIERELGETSRPVNRSGRRLALGSLELALGRPDAALEALDPVMAEAGLGRLLPVWWESAVALHVEALVGAGRAREARPRVEHLVLRARRRGPAAALADALRARAVVLAADGDPEAALLSAEQAVAIHDDLELPFRAARAWFTLGEVRRRARQRSAARAAFETALSRFSAVGTPLWIDRTRSELERVASRRPSGSALTDTERRVAELAAAGNTNKEIAEALFMSVHTVEAHLTRVFRALGVQSRTELARADLDRSREGSGPQP